MRLRCQGGPADGWGQAIHYNPGERIALMDPMQAIGVRLCARFILVPTHMPGAHVYVHDRRHLHDGRSVRIYVPEDAGDA